MNPTTPALRSALAALIALAAAAGPARAQGAAPTITTIAADNRGRVVFTASADLDPATITTDSVAIFTAGPDSLLGTADDVQVTGTVSYDAPSRRITITAPVAANSRYKIFLDGSVIKSVGGVLLDGEFNGQNTPTGNGTPGGSLVCYVRTPASPIARFTTSLGVVDVELFRSRTPATVANFLAYANEGVYDRTFIHRSVANFVIQGGGFFAEPGFAGIPTKPSVQNEPGISNTRGTIAMAKLPNDPNSATNQWFFNLRDNSGNLDQQNGGFTVFGEVLNNESIAVVDQISELQKLDASSVNGSFGELPVLDLDAVNGRGGASGLQPTDLMRFTRIALLMDLAATPPSQLPQPFATFTAPGGGPAVVRFFDVSSPAGQAPPDISRLARVRFASPSIVSSVEIFGDFPGRSIGVQIAGAARIGAVNDTRATARGDIAFVIASGPLDALFVRGNLTGYPLNGIALPGGEVLEDDLTSSGNTDAPTAVLLRGNGSYLNVLDVRGDLTGAVITPGGLYNTTVRGVTRNADMLAANNTFPGRQAFYNLGVVQDTSVGTNVPINSITATSWERVNAGAQIQAPAMNLLRILGTPGSVGTARFDAALTLTEGEFGRNNLTTAYINAGINGTKWSMPGRLGSLTVRGPIQSWTAEINGSSGPWALSDVASATVTVVGQLDTLTARSWDSGSLTVDSIGPVTVSGPFNLGVTMRNRGRLPSPTGRIFVGGVSSGTWSLAGPAPTINLAGGADALNLTMSSGRVTAFNAGPLSNTRITINAGVQSMTIARWDGGSLTGGPFGQIAVRGAAGLDGLFRADAALGVVNTFRTERGGSIESNTFRATSIDTLSVDGDIRNTTLLTTDNRTTATANTVRQVFVRGTIDGSALRFRGNVGSVSVGSMGNGSGIYVGAQDNAYGLPDDASRMNTAARLSLVVVRGAGEGMRGAFIVAGQITSGQVVRPQTYNFGAPFGVAASRIGLLETIFQGGGANRTVGTSGPPFVRDDYQVRPGYAPPAN
ncbi:MAG: peptidylprolyl isomerase [Phycisphaerales bacterium]|nr:peptidylprolyl isomerase [Phycisphaerales bacterium]